MSCATTPCGAVPEQDIFKRKMIRVRDCVLSYSGAHEPFTRQLLPVYPRNSVVDPLSVLKKGMRILFATQS